MTDIRIGDDDGVLWLFPGDDQDGQSLSVVDGPHPIFVAGNSQYFLPFLFGVCADQTTRTALYELFKKSLLRYAIEALEAEQWSKADNFIATLSEAEALHVLSTRHRDRVVR